MTAFILVPVVASFSCFGCSSSSDREARSAVNGPLERKVRAALRGQHPADSLARLFVAEDIATNTRSASCLAGALTSDLDDDRLIRSLASLDERFPLDRRGRPLDADAWSVARTRVRCEPAQVRSAIRGFGIGAPSAGCAAETIVRDDDAMRAFVVFSYAQSSAFQAEAESVAATLLGERQGHADERGAAVDLLERELASCLPAGGLGTRRPVEPGG